MTDGIADLVREENRRVLNGAIIQLVMGSIYCSLCFGFTFVVLLIPVSFLVDFVGLGTFALSGIATSAGGLVCFWSAWRKVNPFEHIDPMTERQKAMARVSEAAGLGYVDARQSLAGVAWLLLAGPETFLDGVASLKHRLPTGPDLFGAAAELLSKCVDGLPAEDADPPEAFMLLLKLSLIKLVSGHGTTVQLTQKGRGLLR